MSSQQPASPADPSGSLRFNSLVKINGQAIGIQVTIELDPDTQDLDAITLTQQWHQVLRSITNLIATHVAIAEDACHDGDKVRQYARLEKLLLLTLGLYPASDGQPDLKLQQARPALWHLLPLKRPKGMGNRKVHVLKSLPDNRLDL